ncbi:hypothetical protein NSU01_12655 [Paenibacillus sp. FSL H8-0259]|uniref:hypothetical protein n=1 Tax=Paenibacillus sp. FSL H8-0259 TaxID=1920423 RepID=UPI00117D5845
MRRHFEWLPGVVKILVGVRGFDYGFSSGQTVIESVVDQGEKVALLVFKVLDDKLDKIIFDQDLDKWILMMKEKSPIKVKMEINGRG